MANLSMDVIPELISNAGVLAVLIWYLYHTTTKTLPDITKAHNESIENITAQFAASQEQERKYRQAEIEALKTWIKAEASCKYNTDHPRE